MSSSSDQQYTPAVPSESGAGWRSNQQAFLFYVIAAAALFVAWPVMAESPYEREMHQLREQRDKAIAESTKAINARYQQALAQVYQRAVQARDSSADGIKTELETLGPVPSQPAPIGGTLGTAAATPAAGSLPRTMLGKWHVVHIGDHREMWEFKEDGTCAITPGTSQIPGTYCTWSKNRDKIEVRYPNGDITALELPIKSNKLQGTDHVGGRLWMDKDR